MRSLPLPLHAAVTSPPPTDPARSSTCFLPLGDRFSLDEKKEKLFSF
jgi:hypothetical protein